MEKYHIYEEVGSGKHSQVFKGREKMDIEYVAIKRVEKSMMQEVVNEVQVIHRLNSPNVLKFYDWYETRNNVWLILEFCTGGDLLTLIKQDQREPESAIRLFGVDLLAGLQQIHACGFLHGDLRPSNVLIDEYGILKLSGFGQARSIAELNQPGASKGTRDERSVSSGGAAAGSGGNPKWRGDPGYRAPELFSEGPQAMSFASDFWSLGCILFELLTGEPPFCGSSHSSIEEVVKREDLPGLKRREWKGVHMSAEVCGLVGWLLEKDPLRRPTWSQLLSHPFWGKCQTPSPLKMPDQPRFDRAHAAAVAAVALVSSTDVQKAGARVLLRQGSRKEEFHGRHHEELGELEKRGRVGSRCNLISVATVPTEGAFGSHEEHQVESCGEGLDGREFVMRGGSEHRVVERGHHDGEQATDTTDGASLGSPRRVLMAARDAIEGGSGKAVIYSPTRNEPVRPADPGMKQKSSPGHGGSSTVNGSRRRRRLGQGTGMDRQKLPTENCEIVRAPSHGSDGEVVQRSRPVEGNVSRGPNIAAGDEAARVAALSSLRLRGRIRTAATVAAAAGGGRGLSPVSGSASSSIGEHYESSFEEDTEGSSLCDAGLTSVGLVLDDTAWSATSTPGVNPAPATPTLSTGAAQRKQVPSKPGGRDATLRLTKIMSDTEVGDIDTAHATPPRGVNRWQEASNVDFTLAGSGSGSESGEVESMISRLRLRKGNTSMSSERGSPSSMALASGVSSTTASATTTEADRWDGSVSTQTQATSGSSLTRGRPAPAVHDAGFVSSHGHAVDQIESEVRVGMRLPTKEAVGHVSRVGGSESPERNANEHCRVTHQEQSKATPGETTVRPCAQRVEGAARLRDVRELLLHTSDVQVTPIIGNRCNEMLSSQAGEPPGRPRFSRDQLTFEALNPGRAATLSPHDLEVHLYNVYNALAGSSAPVRQRGQILLYLQSLAPVPRVANVIINSTFLALLLRLLRKPRPVTTRGIIASLLGLLVRHATYIPRNAGGEAPGESNGRLGNKLGRTECGDGTWAHGDNTKTAGGGITSTLLTIIGETPAPGRGAQCAALRQSSMAALGELLFYVVTQEAPVPRITSVGGCHCADTTWYIPVEDVGVAINRCLEDTKFEGVQYHAAKTVENVMAQARPSHALVELLVTPSVTLRLFDISRRASSESLRGTAAAGLSHLLWHDIVTCEDEDTGSSGLDTGAIATLGQLTCRVMSEPGALSVLVDGLSEGNSLPVRQAFFNILNLVLWGGYRSKSNGAAVDDGRRERSRRATVGIHEAEHPSTAARRRGSLNPLRRKAETLLETPTLLPRLLRSAERGEGPILRAKAFLALRLALEAASPLFLLKACGARLLQLLEGTIGVLNPRPDARAQGSAVSPAARRPFPRPPPQEYLYECCMSLVDWFCVMPERSTRCLVIELRRRWAVTGVTTDARGVMRGEDYAVCNNHAWNGNSRRPSRQSDESSWRLEAATSLFPVVVQVVNRPLLRQRAVTRAFLSNVTACLALCCRVPGQFLDRTYGDREDAGVSMAREGRSEGSSGAPASVNTDVGGELALRMLLPTVEALAYQAEEVLLPHREIVSEKLLPVICRLLGSPSEDTRAHAVTILRVLLPPLLRPDPPPKVPMHLLGREDVSILGENPMPSSEAPGAAAKVRSAIVSHLLPLTASLLRDQSPIPQYVVRLLLDVAREWEELGTALLPVGGVIAALVGRLLPQEYLPPPPPQPSARPALGTRPGQQEERSTPLSSASSPSSPGLGRPASRVLTGAHGSRYTGCLEQTEAVSAALDPALAALVAILVERDDGGGGDEVRMVPALLHLELSRRIAAAVTCAVANEAPEATEALFALAVTLLGCLDHHGGVGEMTRTLLGGQNACATDSREPGGNGGKNNGWGVGHDPKTAGSLLILLEPLLSAVPAATEALQLCCSGSGSAGRGPMIMTGRGAGFCDSGLRSGVWDVATAFLSICYEVFHHRLLQSLFLPRAVDIGGGPAAPLPEGTRTTCRQLADFLIHEECDEQPRVRVLRLLLVAAHDEPYSSAVASSPLWSAVLRAASGRIVKNAARARSGGRGRWAPDDGVEGGRSVKPAQTLARNIVAVVRSNGVSGNVITSAREQRIHVR